MIEPGAMTLERMKAWLNTSFGVAGASTRLELVEAVALPRHRPDVGEKFSLIFRGPEGAGLRQGMHVLESPDTGALKLFLVPVVSTEPGFHHFEAVINRENLR